MKPPKVIVVGSESRSKVVAVESAARELFGEHIPVIKAVKAPSGVSDQPMSDEETIQGAIERAHAALLVTPEAELGVGLEGGIMQVAEKWFLCGWSAVVDRNGVAGLGASTRIEIIPEVMRLILEEGKDLGEADDQFFKRINSPLTSGYMGIMTDEKIVRADLFHVATIGAFIRFTKAELFEQTI